MRDTFALCCRKLSHKSIIFTQMSLIAKPPATSCWQYANLLRLCLAFLSVHAHDKQLLKTCFGIWLVAIWAAAEVPGSHAASSKYFQTWKVILPANDWQPCHWSQVGKRKYLFMPMDVEFYNMGIRTGAFAGVKWRPQLGSVSGILNWSDTT